MLKNCLLIVFCVFVSSNICFGEVTDFTSYNIENDIIQINQPNDANLMLNKVRKDRNTIANVLNLTPEQIYKTRQVEEHRMEEITPVVNNFITQKEELKKLYEKNCSKKDITAVKREMDKLSKSIRKICKKYDREFEKLLTSEQKSKYKMVQKLRFEEMKNVKKTQRYSSTKSDLRPFGKNISQSAYLEEVRNERSLKTKCNRILKKKQIEN